MGISAYIIFDKGKEILIDIFSNDIQIECLKYNMKFEVYLDDSDDKIKNYNYGVLTYIDRNGIREESLDVEINDKIAERDYMILNWYDKTHVFFFELSISNFDKNPKLLLDFSIVTLKLYSQARLWIEENWFYTLEDLEKIKNKPFDEEWCYKNPKDL